MIIIRLLLYLLLTSFFLKATIYENAEDEKIVRWKLLNANITTSINNIDDVEKESRIIEFRGKGTKYAYQLKVHEQKTKKQTAREYSLSWEMKFSEDFVIIVTLNTNMGERYLIYTPGMYNSYMQYGLGNATTNGEWQKLHRNLQEDISYFDNRVKIISLRSFVLKGNGRIDNIMTEKIKLIKKVPKKVFDITTNSLPSITVMGIKFIQLRLGESYEEEGVSAYDNEDGDINVLSMENIDVNTVGRYMVLYMATDSHGNMALDKRYVHVGNVQEENLKDILDGELDEPNIDDIVESNDSSEEEKQIRIWENELAKRENELFKREKNSNKN